jgi:hypothetical protein
MTEGALLDRRDPDRDQTDEGRERHAGQEAGEAAGVASEWCRGIREHVGHDGPVSETRDVRVAREGYRSQTHATNTFIS